MKRAVRVLRARSARASHARRACEAREFSASFQIPDLLFDCSRVLEYAKIRTVLQSRMKQFSETFLHVVRACVYGQGTEYFFLGNYFMCGHWYKDLFVQTLIMIRSEQS